MICTSRIILYYMSALFTFNFFPYLWARRRAFPPPPLCAVVACERAAQSDSEGNTNNCAEVCFVTALPLPSWVLDRDGGQKAGQQQSRRNGRVIVRTAPFAAQRTLSSHSRLCVIHSSNYVLLGKPTRKT